ncbi:hypothetical protein JHK87_001561 [Glycine soja]|nr:hypothetical protein JHK87_001561 [Glycine soja]
MEASPLNLTPNTPLFQTGRPYTILLISPSFFHISLHGNMGMLMCSGDSKLILDGIHENLLQLNYHDPVMQKTVEKHKILQVVNDKVGAFTNMEGMKLLRLELTTSH